MTPEQEAKDPSTKPARLTELAEHITNPHEEMILGYSLAKNPNTPTKTLLKLGEFFAEPLLENPIFSLLFLEHPDFASKIPTATLKALLKAPTLPLWFIEALFSSPGARFDVGRLAQRREIAGEFLERLVAHQRPEARQLAARSRAISPEQAHRLALEQNKLVNRCLAANPSIPDELLDALTNNEEHLTRLNCVSNLKITTTQLQRLASDENIRVACASRPSLPTEFLSRLSQDTVVLVRIVVAMNLEATTEILQKLSQDPDEFVRKGVAENPNTPNEILEVLAQDPDKEVRQAAREALDQENKPSDSKQPV